MKEIHSKGSLPKHLQIFANQLGGVYNNIKQSQFYEMESITELESKAVDIGYEIIPSIDMITERAYLVGFDAEDTVLVSASNSHYSKLSIYFIEISKDQLKQWDARIKRDRELQQEDMRNRQQQLKDKVKTKNLN